jgi:nucleotide-binding universal stress UspA family protein
MTYRTILVQLDGETSPVRYEIAAALAARTGGHVSACYLKTTLINQYNAIGAIGFLPPEDLNQMIREVDQGQMEASAKATAVAARLAAAAGVGFESRVISGDTPDAMIAAARCADLTILPPPSASPAYNVHASAVEVAMACGGPVLVTPRNASSPRIGDRVLVAWDGGREAARALRDALPLLAPNAVVEVRMAGHGDDHDRKADDLAARLERLGCAVNVVFADLRETRIGEWLKSEAKAADCDMIVMGLYGHARVEEFVLGGVSRQMLHEPALPLLISH